MLLFTFKWRGQWLIFSCFNICIFIENSLKLKTLYKVFLDFFLNVEKCLNTSQSTVKYNRRFCYIKYGVMPILLKKNADVKFFMICLLNHYTSWTTFWILEIILNITSCHSLSYRYRFSLFYTKLICFEKLKEVLKFLKLIIFHNMKNV